MRAVTTGSERRAAAAVLVAAAASGALAAAALPPLDASALAWVAWVPWLVALVRAPPRAALASGAVGWAVLHGLSCWWMVGVMTRHGGFGLPLALVSFAVALGLFVPYGIAAAATGSAAARRWGPAGLASVALVTPAVDALRSRLALGFAWSLPGMTQVECPAALGVADLVGVHGVSALVLLGNVALALAMLAILARRRGERAPRSAIATALAAALAVAAGLAYGRWTQARHATVGGFARPVLMQRGREPVPAVAEWSGAPGPDDVRVALVQGAVPQEIVLTPSAASEIRRGDLQLELTHAALDAGAGVVTWSEAAYPATVGEMPWILARLRSALGAASLVGERREAIVGAVVGVPREPGAPRGTPSPRRGFTNSALLVDEDGLLGRYDKEFLVPFGEYMPAAGLFFWFPRLAKLVGDFRPGVAADPLAGVHGALGTFICYEAVLPQHVADFARHGAEVLVNITNDGWFFGSAAPEQHLRFSVLRAVETRRYLIRCANSGISAVVAPDGRMVGRLEEGQRGLLLATVVRRRERTVYCRLGDAPVAVAGLLAALLAFLPRAKPGDQS